MKTDFVHKGHKRKNKERNMMVREDSFDIEGMYGRVGKFNIYEDVVFDKPRSYVYGDLTLNDIKTFVLELSGDYYFKGQEPSWTKGHILFIDMFDHEHSLSLDNFEMDQNKIKMINNIFGIDVLSLIEADAVENLT